MVKGLQKKEIVREAGIFLAKFNILLIPFYLIIYLDLTAYPLQNAFASLISTSLSALGVQSVRSGFLLYVGASSLPIDISLDCVGWKSAYSLFALVFATPGAVRDKLRFLRVWIPILFSLNFLRVTTTILLGLKFGAQYLEFIHSFLWEEAMIFALLAIWYVWLRKGKSLGKKFSKKSRKVL